MKTRFTFYICLIFWVGCMWQSCHNDNSAMVPEEESGELAMEDVLQMYLGAGFEIDSVKTPKGDTFDTPEKALKALEKWQQSKDAIVTRSSSYEDVDLNYIQIPEEGNRRFYSFRYEQIKVSFTTDGAGNAAFETLMGNFYDGPVLGRGRHLSVDFDIMPNTTSIPLPDMKFLMQGIATMEVEVAGKPISQKRYVVQAYCVTQIKEKKVRVWDLVYN